MPISSFHRIADELGDPSNVTFLAHVGRTGSTLVAQMFEQTGDVVTMAHPLTFYCLDKVIDALCYIFVTNSLNFNLHGNHADVAYVGYVKSSNTWNLKYIDTE